MILFAVLLVLYFLGKSGLGTNGLDTDLNGETDPVP